MKWVRKDYKGNPQVWYSGDVIEKIKNMIIKNVRNDQCSRCDGCGYYDGCYDKSCAFYQLHKIIELIESED